MNLRPMEHTGDSANIAYYRERAPKPGEQYVWCEVMRELPFKRGPDGVLSRDRTRKPTYAVRVCRERVGQIGEFTYAPKSDLGTLSGRSVSRLVRAWLAEQE